MNRRRTRRAVAVIGVLASGSLLVYGLTAHASAPNAPRARSTDATPVESSVAGREDQPSDPRPVALEVVASSGMLVRSGPIARGELLRRLFTSEGLARQTVDLDNAIEVLARRLEVNPVRLTWLEQPLTATVTTKGESAHASVWSVVIFAADTRATDQRSALVPTVMWRTSELDLVWRDGRWLVGSMSATPGPTPALDDAASVDAFARFAAVASWPATTSGASL